MCFRILLRLIAAVIVALPLAAQQRYLVSSAGDVVVLPAKGSAKSALQRIIRDKKERARDFTCPGTQTYGINPAVYTPGGYSIYAHKDVAAQWFTVPSSGRMDSVFIYAGDYFGDTTSPDHQIILRIFKSQVYEGHAPGWAPYNPPPRLCWGYYNSTTDLDMGVEAFAQDATDTTWHSTYGLSNDPSVAGTGQNLHFGELVDPNLQSFPPTGQELWGLGGVAVTVHKGAINAIDLGELLPPAPTVHAGDPIFITVKMPGEHPADVGSNPPFTDPTMGSIQGYPDPNYPIGSPDSVIRRSYHNWKFYEHNSRACGSGWFVSTPMQNEIWYTISVADDVPPTIMNVTHLANTLNEKDPRVVTADLEDCNYLNPAQAGVGSAAIHYSVNSGPDHVITMTHAGGSTWSGSIPAIPCAAQVSYHVSATDINGHTSDGLTMVYQVVCSHSERYAAQVNAPREAGSIRVTGTEIDSASLFGGVISTDDGTAGPFSISNGFVFFGDTMHYAWVGVNGAIALSKTATDTIHVNVDGYAGPYALPTVNPPNLVAAFLTDLLLANDSVRSGHIYHQDSPDLFIVEWDSLGVYVGGLDAVKDNTTFRLILHKSDGRIEFQYDSVGTHAQALDALVGVQPDSMHTTHPMDYLNVCMQGSPAEAVPQNGATITLWPLCPVAVADGWNLVSVPGTSWDYSVSFLFPHAVTSAFYFEGGYKTIDTLERGKGYWLKFAGAGTNGLVAGYQTCADVDVHAKWNLIGSLTCPVSTSSVVATGTTVASQYFGYNGGYAPTSTIAPGKAYWVKVSPSGGTLHMCCDGSVNTPKAQPVDNLADANKITLSQGANRQDLYLAEASQVKQLDFYELPPAGPEGSFDARFSSGRMVETYTGGAEQYVINLQSAKYPVTVSWQMKNAPEGKTFVMTDGGNGSEGGKVIGKVILQGQGSVRIENSAVKTLILKAESGINVPTVFALSKNYPNPFNPVTRMQLDVPVAGQVSVAIYDVLGRKVATLVDGVTEAGYHTLEWNGTNGAGVQVPSGTYFVHAKAGEFSTVEKIMLMK